MLLRKLGLPILAAVQAIGLLVAAITGSPLAVLLLAGLLLVGGVGWLVLKPSELRPTGAAAAAGTQEPIAAAYSSLMRDGAARSISPAISDS